MYKCKACGAANSPDSYICVECGAPLRTAQKKSADSNKEIFSNAEAEKLARTGEQRIELYSSGEKYEKVRKGAVLEKIYKQEQAMGEVHFNVEESIKNERPAEPEPIKPVVINRETSSDIVGKRKVYRTKKSSNEVKSRNIPQRTSGNSESRSSLNADKNRQNKSRVSDADKSKKELSEKREPKVKKKPQAVSESPNTQTAVKPTVKNAAVSETAKPKVKKKPQAVSESPNTQTAAKPTVKNAAVSETAKPKVKKKPQAVSESPKAQTAVKAAVKNADVSETAKPKVKKKPVVQKNVEPSSVNAKKSSAPVQKNKDELNNSEVNNNNKINKSNFAENDIAKHKNLAALAYIGILLIFPFIKRNHSDFCKAHTKQGFAVFVYSLIINNITLLTVIGLRILMVWVLRLNYMIYNLTAAAIGILMLVLVLVPVFSGAAAAVNGVYKKVPIVGKFVKN